MAKGDEELQQEVAKEALRLALTGANEESRVYLRLSEAMKKVTDTEKRTRNNR